jgi:PhzF family phenazine biosynthesis protein
MLGLEPRDLAERPLWMNAGKEQLIVPVVNAAAVQRAHPREAFTRLRSEDGHSMAYVFADAGSALGTVQARFFFPGGAAILEDPATGSACANLGAWFRVMHPGEGVEREISQGEAVGRPSTLYLSVPADAGRDILVGGEVIELGRGRIAL